MGTEESDHCGLVATSSGSLHLTLSVKLRVFETEWSPSYEFELIPVALEAVDVLEAKLRDQADKIARLSTLLSAHHDDISALRTHTAATTSGTRKRESMVFVIAKTRAIKSGVSLIWEGVNGHHANKFVEILPSRIARMLKNRWIDVRVSIAHKNSQTDEIMQLFKNKEMEARCYSNTQGHRASSVINRMVEVKLNDELKVVYSGEANKWVKGRLMMQQVVEKRSERRVALLPERAA